MTNGEKLVKTFPDIELYKKMHGGIQIDFDSTWWNAEYKEPTPKNNLGVDCISREQALNEFCIFNPYDSIGVDKVRSYLKALPSVTPQEPRKGHWIENAPEYQNIDPPYICSECGNMHLRKTNYCDQCGADMREVEK